MKHERGSVPACRITELSVAEKEDEKLLGREGVSSRRNEAKAPRRGREAYFQESGFRSHGNTAKLEGNMEKS